MNAIQVKKLLTDSGYEYNIIDSLDAINKFKVPKKQVSKFYKAEDTNGNLVFIKCFDFEVAARGDFKTYCLPMLEDQIDFLENITQRRPDLGAFKIKDHFTCVLWDESARKNFDILFCIFEYVEGQTLGQIIAGNNEGDFLRIELIQHYAKEIIDVLTYIHLQLGKSVGLISPHNIYVSDTYTSDSPNIFIINFDTLGEIKDIDDSSTMNDYDKFLDFCPESLFRLGKRKPSSDIYCLSTTLYYALTNIDETSLLRESKRSTNSLKSISYYRADFRDNTFINEAAIFKAISILEDQRYDDVRKFSKDLLILNPNKGDEPQKDLVKEISDKVEELNKLTTVYKRKVRLDSDNIKGFDLNLGTTKVLLSDLENIIKSIDLSYDSRRNTNNVVTGESSKSLEKIGFAGYILVGMFSFLITALPAIFVKSLVLPNSLPFWILLITNILTVLSTIKFDFGIIFFLLRLWLFVFLLVVLSSDLLKFVVLVLGLLSVTILYQYISKSQKPPIKSKNGGNYTKLTQSIEKIVKIKGERFSIYIFASCGFGSIFGFILSTLTGRAGG